MSLLGGRGGRSDDWSSPHVRARHRSAERLDGPLDPDEEAWLDDHLASCTECSADAADFASQRLELQALRDHPPLPPRDLWARTAAGIEREAAKSRPGGRRARSYLAPYVLLAGALVVAVAVGSLNINRIGQTATPTTGSPIATSAASGHSSSPAATPILAPGSVAYLSRRNGALQLNHLSFSHVCGPTTEGCETPNPADSQAIGPLASPDTVYGSVGAPLVVFSDSSSGGKVFAVPVPTQEPEVTASPSPTQTASAATLAPSPSASSVASAAPVDTPSPSASAPVSSSPPQSAPPSDLASSSPSAPPSASPDGSVEIARDLKVIDSTAAYAPDGSAFAFTARLADGSQGPDIYLWRVGDAQARPITTDHRSVFGSWANLSIVGSTVTAGADGTVNRPVAFVLADGATEPTAQPQIGLAWRPVVEPHGRAAVYWSGLLESSPEGIGWTPREGRLVVGRWDDISPTAAPSASADTASPDTSASPSAEAPATAPPIADQPQARNETTIASGPLLDWDARWDETGTRLAVWIADPGNPTTGRLSLYVVDPFDGRIDLAKPPLVDEPALAGFSIAKGHLAWAAPPAAGSTESSVLVLAWTGDDFGQVESAPSGDVILVR